MTRWVDTEVPAAQPSAAGEATHHSMFHEPPLSNFRDIDDPLRLHRLVSAAVTPSRPSPGNGQPTPTTTPRTPAAGRSSAMLRSHSQVLYGYLPGAVFRHEDRVYGKVLTVDGSRLNALNEAVIYEEIATYLEQWPEETVTTCRCPRRRARQGVPHHEAGLGALGAVPAHLRVQPTLLCRVRSFARPDDLAKAPRCQALRRHPAAAALLQRPQLRSDQGDLRAQVRQARLRRRHLRQHRQLPDRHLALPWRRLQRRSDPAHQHVTVQLRPVPWARRRRSHARPHPRRLPGLPGALHRPGQHRLLRPFRTSSVTRPAVRSPSRTT